MQRSSKGVLVFSWCLFLFAFLMVCFGGAPNIVGIGVAGITQAVLRDSAGDIESFKKYLAERKYITVSIVLYTLALLLFLVNYLLERKIGESLGDTAYVLLAGYLLPVIFHEAHLYKNA